MTSIYSENIEQHERKAALWLQNGRPDYAEGSMKKAARWRAKERQLSMLLYGVLPPSRMDALLGQHIRSIEARLVKEMNAALY